jgi:hypothetical protein
MIFSLFQFPFIPGPMYKQVLDKKLINKLPIVGLCENLSGTKSFQVVQMEQYLNASL